VLSSVLIFCEGYDKRKVSVHDFHTKNEPAVLQAQALIFAFVISSYEEKILRPHYLATNNAITTIL
jgi:hypothetical protein